MASQTQPDKSMQEMNNAHFNEAAKTWDKKKEVVDMAARVADAITRTVPLNKDVSTCLDFGCGTGLLSTHISPHVHHIHGVDAAQSMIDAYTAKRLPNMSATCIDLTSATAHPSTLPGAPYDLACVHMVLHHIQDAEKVINVLAGVLKPGGVLVVTDLEKTETSHLFHGHAHGGEGGHGHGHGHHHHHGHNIKDLLAYDGGFDAPMMTAWCEGAGLVDVEFKSGAFSVVKPVTVEEKCYKEHEGGVCPKEKVENREFALFMAVARKPM
ncbi:hypothetical protein HK104_002462 [Borealophlyctis nickersoniae]|nr:hypothetical protein HK104_002462 [Borealophlyctis nickersoniae]